MYEKPNLERFGTFRELTQLGLSSDSDGWSIIGIGTSPGCKLYGYELFDSCPTGRS